jgi:hypothetical protein
MKFPKSLGELLWANLSTKQASAFFGNNDDAAAIMIMMCNGY